jgi:integral membrane sensor domain MASE1
MASEFALPSDRIHARQTRSEVFLPIVVAIAYYFGAEAAFYIGTLSDKIFAPFWPPNIVLFISLLYLPTRRWWILIAATFPAHLAAELQVGMPWLQLLVAFATNCLVSTINALALKRYLASPLKLNSLRNMLIYILITAVASPAISAIGGAFVPILGSGRLADFPIAWAHWYGANALGNLTLGSLAVIWLGEGSKFFSFRSNFRFFEVVAVAAALTVSCIVGFRYSAQVGPSGFFPALLYLPLPVILWSAVRFGVKGASCAVLTAAIVLIWQALNGESWFTSGPSENNVIALQLFLIFLSVPMLLLGAATDEAHSAVDASRQSEERMLFSARSANVGLWEYCIVSNSFWVTRYCADLFGIEPGHTPTRDTLLAAVHPEDRPIATNILKTAGRVNEPASAPFRIALPGREVRWIQARAYVHGDKLGNPLRVGGVFMDITVLRSSESEAEQRRRDVAHLTRVAMLGELSGAIAHELNQPLTAILSNAQAARLLLLKDPPNLRDIIDAVE